MVKRVLKRLIKERGLDDVLNELSSIVACWMNTKEDCKRIFYEEGLAAK